MTAARTMTLGCIVDSYGGHQSAWFTASSTASGGADPATSVKHYVTFAQICEAAKIDFLFVTDFPAMPDGTFEQLSRSSISVNVFEPLTILSAMAMVTDRIGLVATASTSYTEPYNVARMFASVDHISGGRAGWNVVTTRNRACSYNFGKDDLDDHATRYERAAEFVDVVTGLWDSWDENAVLRDTDTGRYFDPARVHTLDYKGKYYSVKGPLNIARSPQGRPLITQAGGSEAGKELAAETADVVFIQAPTIAVAKAFYDDLKARLGKFGRKPEDVKILCGIITIVGDDAADAQAKSEAVSRHIDPSIGRQMVAGVLDVDLSDVDYDSPIPPEKIRAESNKGQTYFKAITDFVAQGMTLRQIAARFAEARVGSLVKGSPGEVADHMQKWFEAGACDGFMLRAMTVEDNLTDICDRVIPELRRRGLVREDYTGTTARENLGLPMPQNRFLVPAAPLTEVA